MLYIFQHNLDPCHKSKKHLWQSSKNTKSTFFTGQETRQISVQSRPFGQSLRESFGEWITHQKLKLFRMLSKSRFTTEALNMWANIGSMRERIFKPNEDHIQC